MADYKQIEKLHSRVMRYVDEYKLADAIDTVENMASESRLPSNRDSISGLRDTYRYMIHYMIEGVADTGRDRMYKDISEKLRVLADSMLRAARSESGSDIYSSALRLNNLRKESLPKLLDEYKGICAEISLASLGENDTRDLQKRKEDTLESIFNVVFTSFGSKDDARMISDIVCEDSADETLAGELISSITLSLTVFYDKYKLTTLLDVYERCDNRELSAKALVGLLFALLLHPHRVADNETLVARISLWKDSDEAYSQVKSTIRAILGTFDTERITAKMQNEVIPELMKLRPEIMKKMGEIPSDADPGLLEDNPEWQEMLEKSGIADKLQELSEIQNEGADLMMVTFSRLKQFPFFNRTYNWFLPFSVDNTAVNLSEPLRKTIEALLPFAGMVCESDKYSLALALQQMPEAQSKLVASQFNAQIEQMADEMKDRALLTPQPEFGRFALKAVRDLYRFFKLYRNREGLRNPFDHPFDFISLPVVGDMLSNDEMLTIAGEFYFKRGYWPQALPMFMQLAENDADNPQIWEKIGFCRQQLKNYAGALSAYEKSEFLKTPGPWLLKKLAVINRRLGNNDKAAEYYNRLLEADPYNLKLILNVGNILLDSGDLSGALAHYYHANYLQPDDVKIIRAIAYVEFLSGHNEKSLKYYDRLLAGSPSAEDLINSGHAAMVGGDLKKAESLYLKAASDNMSDFCLIFESDKPQLEKLGVPDRTLRIMLDNLKWKSKAL